MGMLNILCSFVLVHVPLGACYNVKGDVSTQQENLNLTFYIYSRYCKFSVLLQNLCYRMGRYNSNRGGWGKIGHQGPRGGGTCGGGSHGGGTRDGGVTGGNAHAAAQGWLQGTRGHGNHGYRARHAQQC